MSWPDTELDQAETGRDGLITRDSIPNSRKKERVGLSSSWLANGTLKVNIDGSFVEETFEGAIVYVCRVYTGRLVDAFAKSVHVASATQAESLALVETMKFLLARSGESLILKSDCRELIYAFLGMTQPKREVRALINESRDLRTCFSNLQLALCFRESNEVAD